MTRGLEAYGGPFHHQIVDEAPEDWFPRATPEILRDVAEDRELMDRVRSLYYAYSIYNRELRRLQPVADSALAALEDLLR